MPTFLLTIFIAALLQPTAAYASSADSCRERVNNEIAREHRLYRSYLFGKEAAEDAPLNEVRYDTKGRAWIKADDSSAPWHNSDPENQGLTWSNILMNNNDEHANILPLTGIFETKRVNTSELIPYLLQSIRAFECRMEALCMVSQASETKTGDKPASISSVQPIGCIEFTDLESYPECHFAEEDKANSTKDQADARSYCDAVTSQLLFREVELLKLVVEYDAGFRSLLQFSGNFDIFLSELRWPLSGTIRQAANLIGQLQRVPCFLSSCDASPPIDEGE